MMTPASTEFAQQAADIAMRAAARYLKSRGRELEGALVTDLVEALRREVQTALPQALLDAREAYEAHMPKIAEATFVASMMAAGTNAAKEVIG